VADGKAGKLGCCCSWQTEGGAMTLAEIIALASVVISIGTNVALYTHLSSVMHTRFDSVERRLELMQGNLHDVDVRLTKLER
jgi:hypothetical protein